MKDLEILECTLRDGSYPIDYQFTAKDTAIIGAALQNLGFKYIEVGHGLGLNASSSKGKAAETDEIYLKTAQEVLTKAKYGMFFIPGIGRIKDLDLAAKYGMKFVRIGTNVNQAKQAEEYIKYAKDLGMEVSSNLMKSYVLSPEKFVEKALLVEKFGADTVVLVDSAGGMLPQDVKNYIIKMKEGGIQVNIGFHGHNNLSMAIANTLAAVESGAAIVDSSLKGIGRSAGNASTEILLTILKKKGYDLNIDIFKTMDIAEELISPIIRANSKSDSIAITAGYAMFHSSFLKTIYKASNKFSVDPRKLIISVSEVDKVDVPEELAMKLAEQLQTERAALSEIATIDFPEEYEIPRGQWENVLSLQEEGQCLANHVRNLASKTGKQTIFVINIAPFSDEVNKILPYIYESSSYYMSSGEMTDKNEIIQLIKKIDGVVDFIVIDDEKKNRDLYNIVNEIKEITKKSTVLTYKGNRVWVQSIENMISCLCSNLYEVKVGIVGINEISIALAISLSERGARVFLYDSKVDERMIIGANKVKILNTPFEVEKIKDKNEFSENLNLLIGFNREEKIDMQMIENMSKNGIIIDAIFDSIKPDALLYAQNQNMRIFKVDGKAAMAGEMTTVLRTNSMLKDSGESYIGDIRIATPTFIGRKGDIIVDSILKPTEVIGIADGKGLTLNDTEEYSELIKKVELEIIKKKLGGKKFGG